MPSVPDAPDFEQALGDLQDHLPDWWRTSDPSSEIYKFLTALAALIDGLSVLWEQPYLDQVLATASEYGLLNNFAYAWGVSHENLPTVVGQLRDYIAARAADDGSLGSIINTLTSLLNTPQNTTGGPILTFPGALTFPANGSGIPLPIRFSDGGLAFPDPSGGNLVFPVDDSGLALPATFGSQPAGLIMYEFTPGNGPGASIGLVFPANGSGLQFPEQTSVMVSDNVIVQDGTVALGAGDGLIFGSNQFIELIPDYLGYRLTVKILNWLAFDRGALERAVERAQVADWLPTLIIEVPSF
jgi:hypothetical protein